MSKTMSMHQRRKATIEKTATELLEKHNIKKPGFSMKNLIENLGIKLFEEELEANTSGYSAIKNDLKIIAINKKQSSERQRFTMAHELGHLLLHDFSEFNFSEKQKTFFRNGVSSAGMDTFEIEANHFAASLLMPKYLIEDEVSKISIESLFDEADVTTMAGVFQVSEQAMAIRLTTLGVLSF